MNQAARRIFPLALLLVPHVAAHADSSPLNLVPMESTLGLSKIPFRAFTVRDVLTQAPMSASTVELFDGRIVPLKSYLNDLNRLESDLAQFGTSLRNDELDLGVVATSSAKRPVFREQLPEKNASQSNTQWSHQLTHDLAGVEAKGQITQRDLQAIDTDLTLDRTTTHSISGRFLSEQHSSIAQVVQRVVRRSDGNEQKETQVFVNGKQLFRRGRIEDTEARIWTSAFDVPVKKITVPVGPGTVEGTIGVRGNINLDLELNPSRSNSAEAQFVLNFKPHMLADGYVSAQTAPTNVGDAGIEGAITLAKDTLEINGVAGLARSLKLDVKEITVDNLFEGFAGRLFAYANVTVPGKKANDDKNKKRFEKEFYAWSGVKVQQRIFEYKAPTPQPPTE